MNRPMATASALCCCVLFSLATKATSAVFNDDFSGGLNLPWTFLDNFGNVPPEFTSVVFNDADQDLKLIGSATNLTEDGEFNTSGTAYVGLGDENYFFPNEVHATATISPLENVTAGTGELDRSNNDTFVVVRGTGLSGYIFALDAQHGEADLVRVDDGAVVPLGDDAVLRSFADIEQDETYTLRLSAIDSVLTGQVFDESMELLGEVTIEEDTYANGWAGMGAAINDEGDEAFRTLIATSFDDFVASDTLDINLEPPTIDELTAAVRNGSTDARFDIDGNGTVDAEDRAAWVVQVANTYFGDANLDGEFNSSDFVAVFTAGQYEDAAANNSLWGDGDWNGDGDFDSGDFVFAFSGGGYEQGPRMAVVPEPSSAFLWILGTLVAIRRR